MTTRFITTDTIDTGYTVLLLPGDDAVIAPGIVLG